jgi:hypothetical protein
MANTRSRLWLGSTTQGAASHDNTMQHGTGTGSLPSITEEHPTLIIIIIWDMMIFFGRRVRLDESRRQLGLGTR